MLLKAFGSTSSRHDVVCVGGGPANLALAEELKSRRRDATILVLDIGRTVEVRRCPLANRGVCPPCKLCHAVHGVAGAGAYSDGKVSFWPAGSGLLPLAGDMDTMLALDEELRLYYQGLRGSGSVTTCGSGSRGLRRELRDHAIELKAYDVTHAGSEAVQEFYEDKQKRLRALGVVLQPGARVADILPEKGNVYKIIWEGQGARHFATAPAVSLGPGKASGRWLRHILDKLGVQREHTEIEHGVRIEMPYQVTQHIARCHRDAKIKLSADDGSEVRTFCLCQRGFVLAAYYDDMTTVSGYSLRDRFSENTNLALLNRISLPPGSDPYLSLLPDVQAQNERAGGGATVQRLCDFLADAETSAEDLRDNPVRPTLTSAAPGRLILYSHRQTRRNLECAVQKLDRVCPGFGSPLNLVYGPVLEKCWDRVKLAGMETTAPGVYVVGDAAGHARGLVQAAATGLIAARSIAERHG